MDYVIDAVFEFASYLFSSRDRRSKGWNKGAVVLGLAGVGIAVFGWLYRDGRSQEPAHHPSSPPAVPHAPVPAESKFQVTQAQKEGTVHAAGEPAASPERS